MIRGWYTAASGMNAQQKQLDVIAQNLANAAINGTLQPIKIFPNC